MLQLCLNLGERAKGTSHLVQHLQILKSELHTLTAGVFVPGKEGRGAAGGIFPFSVIGDKEAQ